MTKTKVCFSLQLVRVQHVICEFQNKQVESKKATILEWPEGNKRTGTRTFHFHLFGAGPMNIYVVDK